MTHDNIHTQKMIPNGTKLCPHTVGNEMQFLDIAKVRNGESRFYSRSIIHTMTLQESLFGWNGESCVRYLDERCIRFVELFMFLVVQYSLLYLCAGHTFYFTTASDLGRVSIRGEK
mmetsp:Transcript_40297/g.40940  ORF Transcript_40297/g.40940 Transcript_40297/m.40940 type:complete len:116 (+) Transcript_40297:637-984(+)